MTRFGRRESPVERRIHPRGAGPPAITLPARLRPPKDLEAKAPHRMWRGTAARERRPKDRVLMTHRSPHESATRTDRRANSAARAATRIDVARGSVAAPVAVPSELAAAPRSRRARSRASHPPLQHPPRRSSSRAGRRPPNAHDLEFARPFNFAANPIRAAAAVRRGRRSREMSGGRGLRGIDRASRGDLQRGDGWFERAVPVGVAPGPPWSPSKRGSHRVRLLDGHG